jgi:hypothetical protein
MNWITHRAPTEEDGDGDGDVMVHRQSIRGNLKGYWAYRKWHDVHLGTPFLPYTEPKKVSDSASEEPLGEGKCRDSLYYTVPYFERSTRKRQITVNISFQE